MAKDRNGNILSVGCLVKWHDPDEESCDLTRTYEIYAMQGDEQDSVVLIGDDFGEAEVLPCELVLI